MKYHYLTYIVSNSNVGAVSKLLSSKLSAAFEERSSLYLGDYNKFNIEGVDRFSVEPNEVCGDLKEEDIDGKAVIVYVTLKEGSNHFNDQENSQLYNLDKIDSSVRRWR